MVVSLTHRNLGKLWHYKYILENIKALRRYGLTQKELEEKTGGDLSEGPVRLYALTKGFTRMNWSINGGRLVIEASEQGWSRTLRNSIFDFISDNVGKIDTASIIILRVNVESGRVSIVRQGETSWYGKSPEEKLNAIPLITEAVCAETD